MTSFASDNYAPTHPRILAALAEANTGSATPYGDDPWTVRLGAQVRQVFGENAMVFPVLTGTGANVISLMAVAPRWGGVVATNCAHINMDENGAPERVGGLKILGADAPDGKLTVDAVAACAADLGDVHRAQPTVLSLTQATELGTVYSPTELSELITAAHGFGMRVHMDGSRLANAAASLGVPLADLTSNVGVDILSFGGTKNGIMLGEAVIVLSDGAHREAVPFLRKLTGQLASKQRYVSAQLLALFLPDAAAAVAGAGDGHEGVLAAGAADPRTYGDSDAGAVPLWLSNARNANAMARLLRTHLDGVEHVQVTQPTQANSVFAVVPRAAAERLRAAHRFYDWAPGPTPDTVEVRWMCAWNTTEDEIAEFVAAIRAALHH